MSLKHNPLSSKSISFPPHQQEIEAKIQEAIKMPGKPEPTTYKTNSLLPEILPKSQVIAAKKSNVQHTPSAKNLSVPPRGPTSQSPAKPTVGRSGPSSASLAPLSQQLLKVPISSSSGQQEIESLRLNKSQRPHTRVNKIVAALKGKRTKASVARAVVREALASTKLEKKKDDQYSALDSQQYALAAAE